MFTYDDSPLVKIYNAYDFLRKLECFNLWQVFTGLLTLSATSGNSISIEWDTQPYMQMFRRLERRIRVKHSSLLCYRAFKKAKEHHNI
jgi:hypothetical protein